MTCKTNANRVVMIKRQDTMRPMVKYRRFVLDSVNLGTARDLTRPVHRDEPPDPLPQAEEQHQDSDHLLHGLVAHQHHDQPGSALFHLVRRRDGRANHHTNVASFANLAAAVQCPLLALFDKLL